MAVSKASAPGNDGTTAANQTPGVTPPETKTEGVLTHDQHTPDQTGQGTTDNPADARDDQVSHRGYHDSLTGRAVTADGEFVDGTPGGPVPKHRIVADNWADRAANTK